MSGVSNIALQSHFLLAFVWQIGSIFLHDNPKDRVFHDKVQLKNAFRKQSCFKVQGSQNIDCGYC